MDVVTIYNIIAAQVQFFCYTLYGYNLLQQSQPWTTMNHQPTEGNNSRQEDEDDQVMDQAMDHVDNDDDRGRGDGEQDQEDNIVDQVNPPPPEVPQRMIAHFSWGGMVKNVKLLLQMDPSGQSYIKLFYSRKELLDVFLQNVPQKRRCYKEITDAADPHEIEFNQAGGPRAVLGHCWRHLPMEDG